MIDGKHYAMEMHLVFWNKKFENATIAAASGENDALGRLTFLIDKVYERSYNIIVVKYLGE